MSSVKRRPKQAPPVQLEEELPSIWSEVRAKPIRRRMLVEHPGTATHVQPPVEPVIRWTLTFNDEAPRPSMLVVPGPSAHERLHFYRRYLAPEWDNFRPDTIEDVVNDYARDWVNQTIVENMTMRIAAAQVPAEVKHDLPPWFPPVGHAWELLWALVSTPEFVIEEPLREMVDQQHFQIHDLYRALWEFRFALKENATFEPAAVIYFALTRWLTRSELTAEDLQVLSKIGITRRVTSDAEVFDLLFFIVTLAAQNGILNRMVICFDGLERTLTSEGRPLLRELDLFLATAERWVINMQAPVGILIGFGASNRERTLLRKLNQRLARRIDAGLAWTKPA
jgi:hypothetical protein